RFPGAVPTISANGSSNGIVWSLDVGAYAPNGPAILHAYDASNVATEIYNTSSYSADQLGAAVKFTVPTVSNGRVYIGTQSSLDVLGLLPTPRPVLTSLSPSSTLMNGSGFTLTVNGSGFTVAAVVRCNGPS